MLSRSSDLGWEGSHGPRVTWAWPSNQFASFFVSVFSKLEEIPAVRFFSSLFELFQFIHFLNFNIQGKEETHGRREDGWRRKEAKQTGQFHLPVTLHVNFKFLLGIRTNQTHPQPYF
jgi:hypothetical protein